MGRSHITTHSSDNLSDTNSGTAQTPPQQAQADLFERIAQSLLTDGYSIQPDALPRELTTNLRQHLDTMSAQQFDRAGIGRDGQHALRADVRKDTISWITDDSAVGQVWLEWAQALQDYLNRRLFLGLFSFESHFAHYAPGTYYKRHVDAFRGDTNRMLSLVVYLNPDWQAQDGGELVLYRDEQDTTGDKVIPANGTLVTFLSEEFPHEVLPAQRDRYSIAGWFRVNSTRADRLDPPS